MIKWHRLLGLTIEDVFFDSDCEITIEKELSKVKQSLDVAIVKKKEGPPPDLLPDGLENLKTCNLLTYKSHREALNAWAIEELCGHYVSYRKEIRARLKKMPPAEDFGLYAVSARHPAKLTRQVELKPAGSAGVYDIRFMDLPIRVVVLKRVEQTKKNAPWLMFSDVMEKVQFGASAYKWKSPIGSLVNVLFQKYEMGGMIMPYTREDFQRDLKKEVLQSLTDEDLDRLLKGLRPEDRLKGLNPEDRLKGLKPEDVMGKFEPEDRLKGLSPQDVLKNLNPEEIEAYLKKIKAQGDA